MYDELIEAVIQAINANRLDIAQMHLTDLLLNKDLSLNEKARDALVAAVPGSKVVFGRVGLRAGYFEAEGERYYFA
jgi:hypothetical protein